LSVSVSGPSIPCDGEGGSGELDFTGGPISQVEGQPCVYSGIIGTYTAYDWQNNDCTGTKSVFQTLPIYANASYDGTHWNGNVRVNNDATLEICSGSFAASDCMTGGSITSTTAQFGTATAFFGPECLVPGAPTSC
jgi:hypothetical protein